MNLPLRLPQQIFVLVVLLGCSQEPPVQVDPVENSLIESIDAFESGDYHRAIEAIDRSLQLGDEPRNRVVRAALLLFAKQFEKAEAIFLAALDNETTRGGAQVGLAHIRINEKKYAEAESWLQAATEAPQPSADRSQQAYDRFVFELACLGLGWSAANTNQHVRAISWFDRILKGDPGDLLALLGRGNSLIGLNLLGDAEKVLTQVLASHPDNPYAMAELGMIRLKKGDDAGAEEQFRAALARDDKRYTCPHEGLGLLYLRQGKRAEAKDHLEEAIRINPNIEFKKYNGLARIYLEEGNLDEAERLLEKSIANFPHDPEAREMLQETRTKRAKGESEGS